MNNKAKRIMPKSMQAIWVASFFFVAAGCEDRKDNKSASVDANPESTTTNDTTIGFNRIERNHDSTAPEKPIRGIKETQDSLSPPPDSKSTPDEIHLFLVRSKDCNHWAGEDGYDAERRAEIERAMTELKCSTLDSDKIILLKQFHQSPQLIKLIGSADTLSW